MRKTFVCLANSYKHGGRCVAGLCVEDGRWIRLRGKALDGALQPNEYLLDDGSEVRLLDVVQVELRGAVPSACHPEDWQIAPVGWRLCQRPLAAATWRNLVSAADSATTILRGYRDRMSSDEIRIKPLQASLALICPTELWWWIREERGKRKMRAIFRRHHVTYDFAITDPRWLERLDLMPAGIYPNATLADPNSEMWLTISLSEAFHGWHYKLVAAVVVVPAGTA